MNNALNVLKDDLKRALELAIIYKGGGRYADNRAFYRGYIMALETAILTIEKELNAD